VINGKDYPGAMLVHRLIVLKMWHEYIFNDLKTD